jgi:hypothetical protein
MIIEEDRQFLAYVKSHRELGFGRMIQIIGHEWYRYLQREFPGTGAEGGAFTDSTCFALLTKPRQEAWLRLLEAEEVDGMEY